MSLESPNTSAGSRLKWPAIFLCWTLFGLYFGTQAYLANSYFQRYNVWSRTLAVWMICSYIWALMTPSVSWLARRFPLERRRIVASLTAHLFTGTLFSLLSLMNYLLVYRVVTEREFNFIQGFQRLFVAEFYICFLIYLTIVGLTHAYDYYNRYRERELAASQLETKLALAKLDTLRMQLHPHFLFNTLNTISVLMNRDVKEAKRMLESLSDLLRATLRNANTHEVSLDQELEYLKSYLEIEQMRFSDRLKVSMEIDPATLDARVPTLILQPLVENAIRYGIAPRAGTGHLEIRSARINGTVQLQVRDDGPGLKEDLTASSSDHVGLSNTRARLEQLYASRHSFVLSNRPEGGAVVTINIPYRPINGE